MSILANQTEKNALYEMAKSLRFYENLTDLKVSAEDAYKIRTAENAIRSVIESNGYTALYSQQTGTTLKKI